MRPKNCVLFRYSDMKSVYMYVNSSLRTLDYCVCRNFKADEERTQNMKQRLSIKANLDCIRL